MTAARTSHPTAADGATLWLCAILAVVLHGALLFAWKYAPEENAAASIEGDSVEVALVESAAAATAVAAEPQPPTAQPEPMPEPAPVPPAEPPKKDPEMTLPEPPKPTPTPRPASAASPSPNATPQPARARKNPAPRSATAAGTTGGASSPDGTSAAGTGSGKNAKASYVVRPIAAYPPESRAAGEHGVVILRLTVDGSGRPTAVSVAKSSGFPRLDRAAVEAGWRCRVRDAVAGSHLDAPVRFNLSDR
jgi:protein TonB